jgi:hypothetical protein
MPDITLEKLHALVERMAEHMMTHMATKTDIEYLNNEVITFKAKIDQLLVGQDSQARRIDDMNTELKAISRTLDVFNERIANLEIHNFGYRVRDKEN